MRKIAAALVGLLIASLATEASAQYSTYQYSTPHYYNYYGHYNHYYNGQYYSTPRGYYENDIHHGYPGPGVTDPSAR